METEWDTWLRAFSDLDAWLQKRNYKGWEYDDLLASRLVNFLTSWGKYPRIAAVQIAKRIPLNLRAILGVPRLHSTKAFGFMVKGWIHHYVATGDPSNLGSVRFALGWLLENRSPGFDEFCWGNDYDYASRGGFIRRRHPTVVWTSHIQEAFFIANNALENVNYKDVIVSIGRFADRNLETIEDEKGVCLAYAPGIPEPIHNSNLLAAVALIRAWKLSGDDSMLHKAGKAVNWSQNRINRNGSWYYGDTSMLQWIDNYHTAYNLDCLCKVHELTDGRIGDMDIIRRTYAFWRDNLFTTEGIPKFYHDRKYPLDIQATAQAIESFARFSRYDPEALILARRVAAWAISNMRKRNGAFRYRIYRHWKNNLEAIHWGQSTMLSALGYLLYYSKQKQSKPDPL